MTIRVRFIDPSTNIVISDANPESIRITWKVNQSPEWNAAFPKNMLAMKDVSRGNNVEVYSGTTLLLEGVLQDISDKWNDDSVSLNLQGRGILDNLYDIRAYSQAYYENVQLLLVLGELLRIAGWRVGLISSLPSPTQTLTIDLRSEKRLLPQISSLIDGVPNVFFRYGGFIAGKHAIDIGSFGSDSGVELYSVDSELIPDLDDEVGSVVTVSKKQSLIDIINSVEVIGGDVKDNAGVTRAISLKDALAANPALATDPDFPIITDITSFVYHIRNNSIPLTTGSQSTERYTQYAPPKESGNATATAVQTAGLALYSRGVSFLIDHENNVITLSVDAVGKDLFVSEGDTLYIQLKTKSPIIDPFTDEIVEYIESEIIGNYRTTSLDISFNDDKIIWSFDLTDQPITTQENLFVSIYDESKRDQPPAGAVFAPSFAPTFATINATQSGGSADTTLSDGTPAIFVQISVPAPPGGATDLYLAGIPYGVSANGEVLVELDSDPTFSPLSGPIIKVAIRGSGWLNPFSVNLTGYIVWI